MPARSRPRPSRVCRPSLGCPGCPACRRRLRSPARQEQLHPVVRVALPHPSPRRSLLSRPREALRVPGRARRLRFLCRRSLLRQVDREEGLPLAGGARHRRRSPVVPSRLCRLRVRRGVCRFLRRLGGLFRRRFRLRLGVGGIGGRLGEGQCSEVREERAEWRL